MALNVSIPVAGLINISYPFNGQTVSSAVRLAGYIAVNGNKLPEGTQYIIDNLPAGVPPSQVLSSHELNGKTYYLGIVGYYINGDLFREVDYTEDEVSRYAFGDDFFPMVFSNEALPAGRHTFSVVAQFFSLENPGVELYDVVDITIEYSEEAARTSLATYLEQIAPQQLVGEIDMQVVISMLDYVMTQRSEGAIKNDVDFLNYLYDVDIVPDELLPYLAKTLGYDFFAGLLASTDNDTVRQEIRFLPDWQKSAGTKESILVLLRAMGLDAKLTPLYLDVEQNILIEGVNRYYRAQDVIRTQENTKTTRIHIPLTHGSFIPSTVLLSGRTNEGVEVIQVIWDVIDQKPVITYFANDIGSPSTDWLYDEFGMPVSTSPASAAIRDVTISQVSDGITLYFTNHYKITRNMRWVVDYQYTVEDKPYRNTRLSEFFDADVLDYGAPNRNLVNIYERVISTIMRSKPFRTRLREITFPVHAAEIYHVNADTLRLGTDRLGRLNKYNVQRTEVQMNNPMREEVKLTHYNNLWDGFLFRWELDCDRFENRFAHFHSLAIDADLHGAFIRHALQHDNLWHRSYGIIVNDDDPERPELNQANGKFRWLRRVGFRWDNFKGGDSRCRIIENVLVHHHTIKYDEPASPTVQTVENMLIPYDMTQPISPTAPMVLHFNILDTGVGDHAGVTLTYDDTNLTLTDIETGAVTPTTWDIDLPNLKTITFNESGNDFTVTLFRLPDENALENLHTTRPILNNYPFDVGGSPEPAWYIIVDATGDFYLTPFHISQFYAEAEENFQNACCCEFLATVDRNNTSEPFLIEKEEAYNYQRIEVQIMEDQTNQVVARWEWKGSYWQNLQDHPAISITLDPATTIPSPLGSPAAPMFDQMVNPITISGTLSHTAASANQGYSYTAKVCFTKQGNHLLMKPNIVFEDDFSRRQHHDGTYAPLSDLTIYNGRVFVKDLWPHYPDKVFRAAAIDDGLYRSSEGSPSVLEAYPAVRMTLIPPVPLSQLQFDQGEDYDGVYFYDEAPNAAFVHYDTYPLKTIISTSTTYDVSDPDVMIPEPAPLPAFYILDPTPIVQGDEGTQIMTFNIFFDGSTEPASITAETADGTGSGAATSPDDYIAVPPTVFNFPAGTTSTTIDVVINNSYDVTGDLAFHVLLSNPVGGQIGVGDATGVIIDNNVVPPPSIAFDFFTQGDEDDNLAGLAGSQGWSGPWQNESDAGSFIIKDGPLILHYQDSNNEDLVNAPSITNRIYSDWTSGDRTIDRPIASNPVTDDDLYASFLYRINDGTGTGRQNAIQLWLDNGHYIQFGVVDSSGNGQPRLQASDGITTESNNTNTFPPNDVANLAVLRAIHRNNTGTVDRLELWLNPDPLQQGSPPVIVLEPSFDIFDALGNALDFARIRLNPNQNGRPVEVDNIRIGRTWDEVVPRI